MSAPAFAPRDYQLEAIAAVRGAWASGNNRPSVVLPTGAGKTVVFSHLGADADRRGGRQLVIAHRRELITQAAKKAAAVNPTKRVGVVMGGRDEVGADIIIATVQTLGSDRRLERVRGVGQLVVDECHHATADSYMRLLEHFGAYRGLPCVGFTATLERGDGAELAKVWSDPVYTRDLAFMIANGHLVEPRGITVDVEDLDLDAVKQSGRDWQLESLGAAMSASLAPERIEDAWHEHAEGRSTLLFAPTVEFAELMRDRFRAAGVKAEVVSYRTPPEERRLTVEAFERGEITMLCNAMVFTEGTDLPIASCAVIARPTTHHGLYVQMVGRVLRPYPGKLDALVLDVSGASRKHSLAQIVDLRGKDETEVDHEPIGLAEMFAETTAKLTEYRDGKLVATEVDLFHGSRTVWNRTYAGTWFVELDSSDVPPRYLVLINAGAAGWHVAEVSKRRGGPIKRTQGPVGPVGSAYVAVNIPDLGYAMALAEGDITWREKTLADRQTGWRSRPVSQKQRAQLERMRLPVPGSSGEASMVISRAFASARIDMRA